MKKYHTGKCIHGFTLIETLVYMAVLVIVVGALVTTFLSFNTVLVRNATERVLTKEAQASFEYIVQAIRQSDSVNTGMSTFNTSPGTLALTEGATSTRFYVASGVLMFEQNGVAVGPLTSDAATLESLVFNHQTGSTSELVRVEMTLSSHNTSASTTRTFNSGAVLRGSYE
jgi:type II secretory pathway pseudopilin PulG